MPGEAEVLTPFVTQAPHFFLNISHTPLNALKFEFPASVVELLVCFFNEFVHYCLLSCEVFGHIPRNSSYTWHEPLNALQDKVYYSEVICSLSVCYVMEKNTSMK